MATNRKKPLACNYVDSLGDDCDSPWEVWMACALCLSKRDRYCYPCYNWERLVRIGATMDRLMMYPDDPQGFFEVNVRELLVGLANESWYTAARLEGRSLEQHEFRVKQAKCEGRTPEYGYMHYCQQCFEIAKAHVKAEFEARREQESV